MSRETVKDKAARLLVEHRVQLCTVDDDTVRAIVRGTGRWHRVTWTSPGGTWECTCQPARHDPNCPHVLAVRTVTTVPPGSRRSEP